jgi:hypothetical protein
VRSKAVEECERDVRCQEGHLVIHSEGGRGVGQGVRKGRGGKLSRRRLTTGLAVIALLEACDGLGDLGRSLDRGLRKFKLRRR